MIALITSCINPVNKSGQQAKSFVDADERLMQTVKTINNLSAYSFSKIYLVDTSFHYDYQLLTEKVHCDLIVRHLQQYQFTNKGINELLLLLSVLQELPDDEELFKLSGRYYTNQNFVFGMDGNVDFKFKAYDFDSKRGTVSTRGYFVKNKVVYEQFLLECLSEVMSYPKRIVGFRSALKSIVEIIKPKILPDFNTSIEFAAARVLKNKSYKTQFADPIGIEGQIAGFRTLERIEE